MITTDIKIAARTASKAIFADLCKVIPGGVNSPVRACKGLLETPLVAKKGKGAYLFDADDNQYIDYCQSWGALILGHANAEVVYAAQQEMENGSTFGITTEVEGLLARKIIEMVPSIEKIRFVSSGTEATMSAIRLARGFTKRNLLVKFSGNYHGHADFLLVKAGSGVLDLNPEATSAGVPSEVVLSTMVLPYNDLSSFKDFMLQYGQQVAAVIVEPIAGNMGTVPATCEFLELLRSMTTQTGTVLIFDEVMSGFRVAKGGAQALYQIIPDLTCFSKIIGGGFPAGAFGGRAEIMNHLAPLGQVYQAGTLSGNPVAMRAGLTALTQVQADGFYEDLERKTKLITEPLIAIIRDKDLNMCVQEAGSMFTLFFGLKKVRSMEEAENIDSPLFKKFFLFMLEKGIYIPPSPQEAWFVSSAHSDEDLIRTREACLEFIEALG